jgi:hypothetical protein
MDGNTRHCLPDNWPASKSPLVIRVACLFTVDTEPSNNMPKNSFLMQIKLVMPRPVPPR